ncbi:acyl transferase/acyl hydrolase/lysophospholipase [Bisporella sp. PMI_857]|nr:acyl transferase/acyl hydrolase/lysophospholipase [Bisporella sp. PMI_857]
MDAERLEAVNTSETSPHVVGPHSVQDDPWAKSSILSLDGGGIRGFASLCMLKNLMSAIERIEKEEPDPHDSSFHPEVTPNPARATNGSAVRLVTEAEPSGNPIRARTTSSFRFKRVPSDMQPNSIPLSEACLHVEDGYLPCHYFDYIGGTSAGGLNAIMLGRLRMSIDDCIQRYPPMAVKIFNGTKRSIVKRLIHGTSTKYSSDQIEVEIKKLVASKVGSPDRPLQETFDYEHFHMPYDLCKTIVVANEFDGYADQPYLFRTYPQSNDSARNRGPAHTQEIWKIARATSAAPTYFDPITIDGKEYSDGGVGSNNPTQLILDEVNFNSATPGLGTGNLAVLVSIGTGQKPRRRLRVKRKFPLISNLKLVKEFSKITRNLRDKATDVENIHTSISRQVEGKFGHYYRWTGGEGVGGLGIDEWDPAPKGDKPTTAQFIQDEVAKHMAQDHVKREVNQCARELVSLRRRRITYKAEDGRWRRHTYCTLVVCPSCNRYYETRQTVKDHIENDHPETPRDIPINSLVQMLYEVHPRCGGGPL